MRTAYMLISVNHGKVKLVSRALLKLEEVIDLSEVYGRYDIVIKVQVEDDEALMKFYQNKFNLIGGIATVETLIALSDDHSHEEKEEELGEESNEEYLI